MSDGQDQLDLEEEREFFELERSGGHCALNHRVVESANRMEREDIEFSGYVRGVRFGIFITVGFIFALGAAVRIGVAIWEMVR